MNFFFKVTKPTKNEEKTDFWTSYSDLMSGMLLMFILLFILMLYHNQTAVAEEQRVMADAKQQLEDYLGVRKSIIEDLKKEFSKRQLNLEIDPDTGAISLPGNVLFSVDSTTITEEGLTFLYEFIPIYISTLLNGKYRNNIAQIIIEGHTDDTGSYIYNLELSQGRAFSVVRTIFSPGFPEFTYQEILPQFLTANGRSFSKPLYTKENTIDKDKSRRVEFLFTLKDEAKLRDISNILSGV